MKTYIKASEEARYYIACVETDRKERTTKVFYLWRGNKYAREWTPYKEECETFTKEEGYKVISELEYKYGSGYDPTERFISGYILEEAQESTQ